MHTPSRPTPAICRIEPLDWLLAAALALASLAVFWPALDYPFLTHDDPTYLTQEPMVNQGLRPAALLWAWTQIHAVNWHPLTTLTHMTLCELFGLNAGAHHAANLAIHAANAALCFLAFRKLTGQRWPSAFVAAVFALHPLRAESVAWVSELKDLLCGFFWFLALLAYARYTQQRTRGRYALVAVATVGALLSKPMAVTLPATLLLLDFWPLRRWPAERWRALVWEKMWLLLLAVAHSTVTMLVQLGAGAGDFSTRAPLAGRIGNAVVSYLCYIGKVVWPAGLSALYPHPVWWPWSIIIVSAAFLMAVSMLAWRCARSAPWILMGWLWFLGTLLPAIGLIQVGVQAMADRYTYIPAIGLTVAATWSARAALARVPQGRWIATASATVVLVALACSSRLALRPWRDSVALFEHAMRVVDRPTMIRYWLGVALTQTGRREEALGQFQALIREDPAFVNGYVQLASVLGQLKRPAESVAVLRQSVAARPDIQQTWNNLALRLMDDGAFPEAKAALDRAAALKADSHAVRGNLGLFYAQSGQSAEAIAEYREALRLNPWKPSYYNDLAVILSLQGALPEARALLEKALWIDPRHQSLATNYLSVLNMQGDRAAAEKFRAEAARLKASPSQ